MFKRNDINQMLEHKIKTDTLKKTIDTNKLKVGVISDTQLPPKPLGAADTYPNSLRKALKVLKNQKVDIILFAGDIGDLGTKYAFKTFKNIFNEVYSNEKPILQIIMGNHDYWNKSLWSAINHKKAFRNIFEKSPWSHYVVNGMHFIGASPYNGNMTAGYDKITKWLDEEIKKAESDNSENPIFVMTHNQPKNTSYGSEDWGDTTLDAAFSKHPNVINLSGHVHYPVLDERSIWQGKYTVINTQSLSYTELEKGKENGTIPPNAEDTPMGYIIEITESDITFLRINFAKGENGYEEKENMRWTLKRPYSQSCFKYTNERINANEAPTMTVGDGDYKIVDEKIVLSFCAGKDDDFVHSYKLCFDDNSIQYYFSDFYNGIDDMKEKVSIELKNPPKEIHNIKIYAVDTWGKESKECVTIKL
ncbi:MAG: metallophosphoesterase [Oscillospiraceae bacterium]